MKPPYPTCMVPNDVNANHDGGGDLGPLFNAVMDPYNLPAYGYLCHACAQITGIPIGGEITWPPGDGKADFC